MGWPLNSLIIGRLAPVQSEVLQGALHHLSAGPPEKSAPLYQKDLPPATICWLKPAVLGERQWLAIANNEVVKHAHFNQGQCFLEPQSKMAVRLTGSLTPDG